jgi:hypothetical protein
MLPMIAQPDQASRQTGMLPMRPVVNAGAPHASKTGFRRGRKGAARRCGVGVAKLQKGMRGFSSQPRCSSSTGVRQAGNFSLPVLRSCCLLGAGRRWSLRRHGISITAKLTITTRRQPRTIANSRSAGRCRHGHGVNVPIPVPLPIT